MLLLLVYYQGEEGKKEISFFFPRMKHKMLQYLSIFATLEQKVEGCSLIVEDLQ